MGFFGRIYNLWKGFLGVFVGRMEEKHPEIAYENAINAMTEKYSKLKSAAAGLIKHRAKLEASIQKAEKELEDINLQVQMAVEQGEDEIAVALLERQEELETALNDYRADLERAAKDAETAKDSLRAVKEEIEKLKREKDKVIAQIKDAEARKQIQEQLDGISVEDDIRALGNVREYADRVRAEVQIGDELETSSMEGKLKALKGQTGSMKARARLEALKAKRTGAAEGGDGQKTL
ncbi:PspA/IM30 family protein [Myxococcota bacterium]|nr:PspA/IM30 family protein [Myxococcota bacterium]MBU1432176.1 PspA/IM30 family protein [Myxococcota bacterium]MBU1899209.1 PspA/IM30 family protein [Myxococcota bacterium]